MVDEEALEAMLEAKHDFEGRIARMDKEKIRELIRETPEDFQRERRFEYLKAQMDGLIIQAWWLMARYELFFERDKVTERMLVGEDLSTTVKEILDIQGKIILLRRSTKDGRGITGKEIQQAKLYPIDKLITLKNNQTTCPFHNDRSPSMRYYPGSNTVYCFSCHRSWDTIAFVMEKDGLSFGQAVRYLCQG